MLDGVLFSALAPLVNTFNVLVEFREQYFEITVIPRDRMPCLWVVILLLGENIVQMAKSRASVSIG